MREPSEDEGSDLPFVTQQGTELCCLVSWSRRCIDEVPMRFVNILNQHGRGEAGRLVLKYDLPRAVSFFLVEPDPRIEKKKVWDVFILQKSLPVRVIPRDDTKIEN